ncbi:kinase-like protein [Pyrenochaeta sp. DS3sAY3a]|nr:kinase-like protein [Pyrenochaeta sp. DS3sAY3a]
MAETNSFNFHLEPPYDNEEGDEESIRRIDNRQHERAHDINTQSLGIQQSRRTNHVTLGEILRKEGLEHFDKHRQSKYIWPSPLMQQIMTRERIICELHAYESTEPEELAETILQSHFKVFAVLVLAGKGSSIRSVITARVEDTDLPLQSYGTGHHLYKNSQNSEISFLECFEDWDVLNRESFFEYQFAVDPCELNLADDRITPRHEDFHDEVYLPFKHEEKGQSGGYGVVTKVTIHKGCHKFHPLLKSIKTGNCFARKQLLKNDAKEFENEAAALRRFNGFGNDHMVTFLMTWTLKRSYNLLFPWATRDLDAHWAKYPRPTMDAETLLWTSKQIAGIASAIRSIHNPASATLRVPEDHKYGRHGGLKAENILLFDSPDDPMGILVVAGLGLAKLNSIVSRSAQSNNHVHCTTRYKPPECDIDGAKITRSYDVWTFGCLLLEWVCWLFQGQEVKTQFIYNLGDYNHNGVTVETFFNVAPVPGQSRKWFVDVHDAAREKFAELHGDPKCTQYFHDLLHLVEEHMLVVRAKSRIDSEKMHQELTGMHQRAGRDKTYYYTPCESSHQSKIHDALVAEFRKPKNSTAPHNVELTMINNSDAEQAISGSAQVDVKSQQTKSVIFEDATTIVEQTSLSEKTLVASTLPGSTDDESETDKGVLPGDNADTRSLISVMDNEFHGFQPETEFETAVVHILASNDLLSSLYAKGLQLMPEDRFINNYARILREFHARIVSLPSTTVTHELKALLRSKENRKRIAKRIIKDNRKRTEQRVADKLADAEGLPKEEDDFQEQARLRDERWKMWLDRTTESGVDLEREDPEISTSDENIENELGDTLDYLEHHQIIQALVESQPFQDMLLDLKAFLLPDGLLEDVLPIPSEQISFGSHSKPAFVNTVQGWVEDITELEWDWWPLSPRMRPLRQDETRIFWRCVRFPYQSLRIFHANVSAMWHCSLA